MLVINLHRKQIYCKTPLNQQVPLLFQYIHKKAKGEGCFKLKCYESLPRDYPFQIKIKYSKCHGSQLSLIFNKLIHQGFIY